MNIFDNPQHKAQIGYNPFDMSKTIKFSSSVGHILPVYYDLLNPGDKITASSILRTRTMPLDSGAFTSIEENIDWFFVPMEQIYHAFTEFYYGVQDFNTSLMNPASFGNRYPYINFTTLCSVACSSLSSYNLDFEAVETFRSGALRLLDLLGFPIDQVLYANSEQLSNNYAIIPILLQVYQKIYMDYYRLSDREANDPRSYNVDDYYANNEIQNPQDIAKMLRLHYVPWKKDFYTNLQISPIFGPDQVSGVNNYDYSAVNQWLSSTFNLDLIDKDGASNSAQPTTVGYDSASILQNGQGLNVANIRAMFALDKLLEITRRAGKHYDKQTLAHFGVDVPNGISGECYLLNRSQSRIDIGDVIATGTGSASVGEQTATSVLGQVGGKGFGANETGKFDFEAPCHGVLMAVYYARPVADYYQKGIDKLNTLIESVDWFKPEFDNLGQVPLFKAQVAFDPEDSDVNSEIVGWWYRYSEIKAKPNSIHGNMSYIDNFKIWSTGKAPISSSSLSHFLVNPNYLNSIMMVDYESKPATAGLGNNATTFSQLFGTDPLLHQIYFDVRKASKMSTFGLPQL